MIEEENSSAMAAIASPSTSISTRYEKIAETTKKVFYQICSLVSVISTMIKHAGYAAIAAMRIIEVDLLKESLGILQDWFTWFLSSIFALKFTDAGKAFFTANNSVLKALFLIRFISFLATLLATLFQMHKRTIGPLLLMLVLESGATILAASLFSSSVLWLSLTSWLCIFMLFGYCFYPELKEQILKAKSEEMV